MSDQKLNEDGFVPGQLLTSTDLAKLEKKRRESQAPAAKPKAAPKSDGK